MKKLNLFFILITVLLIITSCKVVEQPQEEHVIAVEPTTEMPSTVPEAKIEILPTVEEDMVETPITTEAPQVIIPQVDIISKEKCVDDRIELVLTNPTDQTLTLAKNIIIHLNGLIIVDPECDKNILMPGESVYCADISGHLAIREGKKNAIQISIKSEKSVKIIDCGSQE